MYAASAAAVPFLYELLTAPEVQDKPAIAHLLASIAEGVGYLEVHAVDDFGVPTWRKILSDQGKTLEGELAREAAETRAVHRAASAGLRHLGMGGEVTYQSRVRIGSGISETTPACW